MIVNSFFYIMHAEKQKRRYRFKAIPPFLLLCRVMILAAIKGTDSHSHGSSFGMTEEILCSARTNALQLKIPSVVAKTALHFICIVAMTVCLCAKITPARFVQGYHYKNCRISMVRRSSRLIRRLQMSLETSSAASY